MLNTEPASGSCFKRSSLRPMLAVVINSVLRLGPPKQQDVTCDAGREMRCSSSPVTGSWHVTQYPPQWATHSLPCASVHMPSGTPNASSNCTTGRRFVIVPLDASKSNASTRLVGESIKYIVRPSKLQSIPLEQPSSSTCLTIVPAS